MAEGTLVITISNQVAAPPIVSPGAFDGTFITGWHVASKAEYLTIINAYGGILLAGGHLRQAGIVNWNPPNTGADNSSGFTALGSGLRNDLGVFENSLDSASIWTATEFYSLILFVNDDNCYLPLGDETGKKYGMSIRLIKDSTTLLNGQTSSVSDFDGNVYPTVCIAGLEVTRKNLLTTHYADGTPIPIVTGDAAWAALTTAGMCYYNNTP